MPLYEYKCKKCGHKFEALVSMERRDEVKCEKCDSPVQRVYEGPCAFGVGCSSGSGCAGNCSGCAGCHH